MTDLALSEETAVAPADVFVDGTSITELDLEETCKGIVTRLIETNDTTEIERAVTNFNGVEKLVARAKSKLIFQWSQWFHVTNPNGSFAEWYTQKFGGEQLTVQKHQAIGELLLSDEVPDNVKQLNTKELVSVARAKQSGYDLDEHWEEIAHAGSEAEVNQIVRKVKGSLPRSGTLDIVVEPDGTVNVWKNGRVRMLLWFNVADRDDPNMEEEIREMLKQGIARTINNTRMRIK